MNYILMLIANHSSHTQHGIAEPGDTRIPTDSRQRQAPAGPSLSEYKESQKATWIPEKFSLLFPKRLLLMN